MVDDPLAAHLAAHYDLGFERDRLFREGEPRLELTRTLELLDRFLPSAPARLIDVGGGPGTYAAVWAPRRLGRPARPALRHPRVTIHSEATS